jgi:hypothetical protein
MAFRWLVAASAAYRSASDLLVAASMAVVSDAVDTVAAGTSAAAFATTSSVRSPRDWGKCRSYFCSRMNSFSFAGSVATLS